MSEDLDMKLSRMQHELDAIKEDFDEFAYIVSHDMAAPFRQINGFAEIILSNNSDSFDDKTKRHFEFIQNGSERGSRMIEALLTYSRLCTKTLQVTSVDSNEIVEEALEQLAPLIQDAQAEINCAKMPVVEADRGQLEKLFFHVLHNALHYRAPGSHPKIELDVLAGEDCLEFRVKDNGIGISDRQKDKIFVVLRRGVGDKDYEGIGMGLSIANRILQNHGGRIWVDNACECGSTFHFTLPGKVGPNGTDLS